ncbi:MAG TPA: hypothetical protein VFR74_11220 [Jiangellales bacterium]|nr:hypothetical protein [Jiangellales bacterium]
MHALAVTCRRRPLVAVAVVCGLLAVGGCGGDSAESAASESAAPDSPTPTAENGIDQLSPGLAVAAVRRAMTEAGSYRVSGTTMAGGAIDIAFVVGQGSTGTVDLGAPVDLVSTDGRVYITGDEQFLAEKVGGTDSAMIAGKWILLPEDSTSGFAIFVDGQRFAATLFGDQGVATMTPLTDVEGVPAVGLVFPETGGTLWVAAEGPERPLRFEEKGASGGQGVLLFGDYGAEVALAAPPEDQVVSPEAG